MAIRFGNTVYYGDPSRRDLLEAAGAHDAKLLVISVDDTEKAIEIIETAQKHFPNLKILARAIDRRHAYQMIEKDIHYFRQVWGDEKSYGAAVRARLDDLKQVLQEDQEFHDEQSENKKERE